MFLKKLKVRIGVSHHSCTWSRSNQVSFLNQVGMFPCAGSGNMNAKLSPGGESSVTSSALGEPISGHLLEVYGLSGKLGSTMGYSAVPTQVGKGMSDMLAVGACEGFINSEVHGVMMGVSLMKEINHFLERLPINTMNNVMSMSLVTPSPVGGLQSCGSSAEQL